MYSIEEWELVSLSKRENNIRDKSKISKHYSLTFGEVETDWIGYDPDKPCCFYCSNEGVKRYGLDIINKVWLCEMHLQEFIDKEPEIESLDWLLIDDNPYSELNECDVIGCKEMGRFLYGFDDTWKVRLCKKHLDKVILNELEDLDSLHKLKKKKTKRLQNQFIQEELIIQNV